MIGTAIAGPLAATTGAVLIGGLVAVIRLTTRISEGLTSVRILADSVVGATDDINEHVSGIGTNVRGILEEAQGIAAFVSTLPTDQGPPRGQPVLAVNTTVLTQEELA